MTVVFSFPRDLCRRFSKKKKKKRRRKRRQITTVSGTALFSVIGKYITPWGSARVCERLVCCLDFVLSSYEEMPVELKGEL